MNQIMEKLDNKLIEDTEDMLLLLQEQFDFEFEDGELINVVDFNDLISAIVSKIDLENENSCTSQQAFYKIRKAIKELDTAHRVEIGLSSDLETIFPEKGRLKKVRDFEAKFGDKLYLLEPNIVAVLVSIVFFIASFVLLFINILIGLSGLFISWLLMDLIFRFGKNLRYKTIRDLIEDTVCENYLDYRSNTNTINKNEFRKLLLDWFATNLDIEKEKILNVCFR